MTKIKFIVYGTLRDGGRLREHYKISTITSRVELKGFTMVDSRFGYPIATPSKEHSVIVDIVEATNKEFNSISRMEMGAGYIVSKENELNLPMYIQEDIPINKPIKNWIEYVEQQLPESTL